MDIWDGIDTPYAENPPHASNIGKTSPFKVKFLHMEVGKKLENLETTLGMNPHQI